jgi:N-acetylglucosamine-6-phosphate deacetylase
VPRDIPHSASLLGAHAEGPYIHPSKKGAHNESLFQACSTSPTSVYGANLSSSVKLITLAPELPDASNLIKTLTAQGIRVSMGHSTAIYSEGIAGLHAGATCLTHTLNAMQPLASRAPGLAGLISLPEKHTPAPPFYTIIADGEHLHPQTVSLLHRTAPRRSILITDSIELASLPDGTYPGHSQIPFEQTKKGTRATIAGTDTLIGGCIPLQESVRNLMEWSGCGIAEAVGTVTENVARFMGIDGVGGRGVLAEGRRADLCILNEEGEVLQTWISGHKVWDKEEEIRRREDDGEARG